jgi:hypothetical protein
MIGFIEPSKRVVAIPAESLVTARSDMLPTTGVCTVTWEEQMIMASGVDLEQNAVVISDTSIG